MFAKFFQFKKNLFLAILLLVIFVLPTEALAQDLLTVGSASSVLSGTESAIFANISNSSPTSTFLLMLKSGNVEKFSVDKDGNANAVGTVTAGSFSGPLSGTISAGNVSNGSFGSFSGGGNYSFPSMLGIGVAAPSYPLHISSTSTDTGLLLQNNTLTLNNSASLRFLVSTNATPANEGARLIFTRTDNPAAADGDLAFWTRGNSTPAERMRINSLGNVGIGTTNPGSRLQINGSTSDNSANALDIKSSAGASYLTVRNDGFISINNGTTAQTKLYSANSKFIFSTPANYVSISGHALNELSALPLVLQPNSGNIGIGTTAPSSKLEIQGGPLRLTGTYLDINRSGSPSSGISWYSQSYNAWASFMSPTGSGMGPKGNLTIPSGSLVTSWALRSFIENPVGYGWTFESGASTATTTAIKFEIRSSDGSFRSYGNGTINGNLGVGTTNPYSKISFGSSGTAGNPSKQIAIAETGTGNYFYGLGMAGSSGQEGLGLWGGSEADVPSVSNPHLFIKRSSGNVGIGTTTPSAKLSVSGGNIFINDAVIGSSTPQAAITKAYLDSALSAITSANYWLANGNKIYNTNTDNVGVGTTNPLTNLEIKGASGTPGVLTVTSGDDNITDGEEIASLQFRATPGGARGLDEVAAKISAVEENRSGSEVGLAIYTADYYNYTTPPYLTERIRINRQGLVGIGVSDPKSALDVNGSVMVLNGAAFRSHAAPATSTDYIGLMRSNAANELEIGHGGTISPANIKFMFGNNEFARLTSSGYFGIGTTTPEAVLDVNGLIKMRNTIIGTSSDVINKGYLDSALSAYGNWGLNGSNLYASSTSWNVGIGTTNPGNKISITQTVGVGSEIPALGTNGGTLGVFSNNQNYGLIIGSNSMGRSWLQAQRVDGTATAYDLLLNPNGGNVGIGTTTPGAKLAIGNSLGLTGNGLIDGPLDDRYLDFSGALTNSLMVPNNIITTAGKVGVGTTAPTGRLGIYTSASTAVETNAIAFDAGGSELSSIRSYNNGSYFQDMRFYVSNGTSTPALFNALTIKGQTGNVGIGTTTPSTKLYVNGVVTAAGGLCMGGVCRTNWDSYATSSLINFNQSDLTNIRKLTVGTIDPLYRIDGTNYSSFASAIVGGVKEEYLGRAKISQLNKNKEYEYRLDFSKLSAPSDLWVWRQTIDFSPENVEVNITPYGSFASTYYTIEDNAIIFRADRPVSISYRLSGKRLDWQKWPTKANNQQEKPSFIINNGQAIK